VVAKINRPKDLLAGALYVVGGGTTFLWAQKYEIGTATRMGPGYFPALLGLALILFGIAATVKGLVSKQPDPLAEHKVGPLVLMTASVISFGLLIERADLVVATFACLLFVCFRRLRTNPLEVLLLFMGVTIFNVVVFVDFIGMQIPLFWWDQ
jgi:putative tricarboxylic transport membrane protein